MSQILQPIFALFRNHKLKMLYVFLFGAVFFIMLFPNGDLSDSVSAQIIRGSGIYIEFDDLDLDLLPTPGLSATHLSIEPRGVPPLKADDVETSMSLTKLIAFKLGFSAHAGEIFKGEVDFTYGQGSKTKSGTNANEISIRADRISLEALCDYLRAAGLLPVKLEGRMKIDSQARFDHMFAEQPSATVSLDIPKFSLPSQSITVDFNGVPVQQQLPALELGRLAVRNLKLNEGILEIPDLAIGDGKSEINGKIRGSVGLQLRRDPGGVRPEMSSVDLAMDLTVDKGFMERNQKTVLGGFLILIPATAKQETPKGTRLAFRLKVNRPGEMPNFQPLTEKL